VIMMQRFRYLSRLSCSTIVKKNCPALFHTEAAQFAEVEQFDPLEHSREEVWARKHDMELIRKLAERMRENSDKTSLELKRSAEDVKREVKEEIAKRDKVNDQRIQELHKKIDDLRAMLSSALREKQPSK
jgi:gas vesicle protein